MTTGTSEAPGTACLRCAGANLVPAQLQHTLAFCVDEDAHHGVRHLCLKASLCRDCGHVEFWVGDPARALRLGVANATGAIQEEDF